MRIKYSGSDESRDLAVRGGCIVCPRGQWVDVEKEAAKVGIDVAHAVIVARSVDGDDWEIDVKKSTEPAKPGKEK